MQIDICTAAAFLQQNDRYTILTHRRPDGDTVGCAAALCLGLRQLGKDAALFPNEQITPRLAPYTEGLTSPKTAGRTIVAADISTCTLLPFGAEKLNIALCIDHHASNDDFADNTLLDASAAACAELVFRLLQQLSVCITTDIANALYLGLSTDTGCFQYANVTAETFLTAANLIKLGAQTYAINKVMFATKSLPRLRLEAYLTDHLEMYANGRVGLCQLSQDLIDRMGVTEDDADGLSGFARCIEGVQIAGMLREIEGGLGKISLRTGTDFNAAAICERMGGGGHRGAAGASVPGGIPGARAALLQAIAQETGLEL